MSNSFQSWAETLRARDLEPSRKLQVLTQLKETVDFSNPQTYANFLQVFFPIFKSILESDFTQNYEEKKLKTVILELLSHIPQESSLEPYAPDLLKTCLGLLQSNADDLGTPCIKLIFGLYRHFRNKLFPYVGDLVDLLIRLYQNVRNMVSLYFVRDNSQQSNHSSLEGSYSQPSSSSQGNFKTTDSFRVLAECPLIFVYLVQIYPEVAKSFLPSLITSMFDTVSVDATEPQDSNLKPIFQDFILCQVKIIQFFSFLIRDFYEYVQFLDKSIANVIVRLLRRCPSDCVQSRKELLVATRHILGTSLRSSFAVELENLIDESTLFGSSETISESIKSLGYSFLAELVHLMRQDLSYDILNRVITIFCRNILDSSLSLPVQFTSAKLLVSLSETVQNQSGNVSRKALFIRIIATFVERFESLIERIFILAETLKYVEEQQMENDTYPKEDNYSWFVHAASFEQLDRWEADLTNVFLMEWSSKESKSPKTVDLSIIEREELHRSSIEKDIADCKLLVKTMMQGIRTVLSSLQRSDVIENANGGNANPQSGVVNASVSFPLRKLNEDECLLLVRLLRLGCNCLSSLRNFRMTDEKEEKELVNQFSQIFTELSPKSFQEIFSVCVGHLCSCLTEQPFVLQLFQHLIASQLLSKFCVNILLAYLTENLYLLEAETIPSNGSVSADSSVVNIPATDTKDLIENNGSSSVYLSLFKTLFASVTLFSDNEAAVRPYIFKIVKGSLDQAKRSPRPCNYFRLLRAFFKSLTGGKFELLYKDLIPLLRVILTDLVGFLETGYYEDCRGLLIELCLTIPARPSSILPHLTLHIRPLLLALQSDSPDIILLGLRTLEFWIEMLHPEYLEDIFETMRPTFMQVLWNGVYHSSQRLASCFLKILGKLGGTCRKWGPDIVSLQLYRPQLHPVYLEFREYNIGVQKWNMAELLDLCSNILQDAYLTKTLQVDCSSRAALDMKKSVYFVIKSVFLLLMPNGHSNQQQMINIVRHTVGDIEKRQVLERVLLEKSNRYMRDSFYYFRNKERNLVTEIVKDIVCVAANSTLNSSLNGDPKTFLRQVLEYFVFRWILVDVETTNVDSFPLNVVVALFQVIEEGSLDIIEFTLSTIGTFFQIFKDVLGANLFSHHSCLIFCLNSFTHLCYTKRMTVKVAALKGIILCVENVDESIILNPLSDVFFLHILRGVFSVIRDAQYLPNRFSTELTSLMELLILKTTKERVSWDNHSFPLELYSFFASELCSSSEECRVWAQKLVTEIANVLEAPAEDVFNVTFDQCLKILRMKSLRFSSFGKQVAYVSMANFLMESGIITPDLFGLGIQGDEEFERITTRRFQDNSPEQRIADFHQLLKNILIIADDSTHNRLVEADEMALYKLVDNRLTDEGVIHYIVPLKIQCLQFIKSLITSIGAHFRNVQEFSSYLTIWTSNRACRELLLKINKVLFQSLESSNEEISRLSIDSLQILIEQHCLSKEDLHNNLKPLLSTFGDSRKLSVRCLQGLERVLSLFSSWFNRAIIEKLLEHLKMCINSCMQNQESLLNQDWRLPVGAARIFAKLPSSVIEFQDAFFKYVLQLEDFVSLSTPPLKILDSPHSVSFSPFRQPLLSFCNAFPQQSLDYLFKMIGNERFRHLFLALIEAKDAEPLRRVLMDNYVRYIELLLEDGVSGLEWPSLLVCIVVIRVLATWQPSWLQNNTVVYNALHRLWQVFFVQSLFSDEYLNDLEHFDSVRQLVRVVIIYYCQNMHQMDVLFLLFSLFGRERHLMDFTFVKNFLNNSEQSEYGVTIPLVEVFKHFLQVASDVSSPSYILSSCLHFYLIPNLERSFRDSPGAIQIPKHLLEALVTQLLDSQNERWNDDALSSELLRLSTLLIMYIPNELLDFRKELIKFGWDNLKKDDSHSKYWAFVKISRFFEAFQAPEKVVCQVFLALLRAWNAEGKVLTRHALSVLTPIIPLRVSDDSNSGKAPTIARYTRKILSDEGFTCSRLSHIWSMICKHPLLFYRTRSLFIPLLTGALKKFTSSTSTMLEFRRMILNLIKLLLKWEFWSKQEGNGGTAISGNLNTDNTNDKTEGVDTSLRHSAEEDSMVIDTDSQSKDNSTRYLIDLSQKIVFRLMLLIIDNVSYMKDLLTECYAILAFSCREWHHFDLNVHQLESLVSLTGSRNTEAATDETAHDGATSSVHSSVTSTGVQNEIRREESKSQVLDSSPTFHMPRNTSTTESQPSNEGGLQLKYYLAWSLFLIASKHHSLEFFKERASYVKFLVKTCARTCKLDLMKMIGRVLMSISGIGSEDGNLYVNQLAQELCADVKDIASPLDSIFWLRNICHLLVILLPLNVTLDSSFLGYLTKALVQAIKERSSSWFSDKRVKETTSNFVNKKDSDNEKSEAMDHLIGLLVTILSHHLLVLNSEERRYLMQSVMVIIDNCSEEYIVKQVLDSIRLWIYGCDDPEDFSSSTKYLATKEKVQLIGKLHHFERNECSKVVGEDFYRLILAIFVQRREEFQEYLSKMERALACGLFGHDWNLHRKLMDIWMREENLKKRQPSEILFWILSEKDWESFADYYWLSLGTELVLENIQADIFHLNCQDSFDNIPSLLESSPSMQQNSNFVVTYQDDMEALWKLRNELKWDNLKEALQHLVRYCSWAGEIVWKELFVIFWSQSDSNSQALLEESICKLVAKRYHSIQRTQEPNIVQSILVSAEHCGDPFPRLAPEILAFLGIHFRCHALCLRLLHKRIQQLSKESSLQDEISLCEWKYLLDAKAAIYKDLQEWDAYWETLKELQGDNEYSKNVFVMMQLERWNDAQHIAVNAMNAYQEGGHENLTNNHITAIEEAWIESAKQLNQWDILTDFSRSIVHTDLLHECLWRLPDWAALKEVSNTYPVDDIFQLKIYQISLQLQENKLENIGYLFAQGYQELLNRFKSISRPMYVEALETFSFKGNLLVELEESNRILMELNSFGQNRIYEESRLEKIFQILTAWRERLPNEWEYLTYWNELLTWRSHMYTVLVNAFEAFKESRGLEIPSTLLSLGVNESAWSVNMFAKVARKQGLTEVCLQCFQKMYHFPTMHNNEYFTKVKQQAKSSLHQEHFVEDKTESSSLQFGLNQVNGCNVENFGKYQQAQLLVLKAKFYHRLGSLEDANQMFATALSHCGDLSSGWLSWGEYCDDIFTRSQDFSWASAAVNCYFQAIIFGSKRSRAKIARILRLLSLSIAAKDKSSMGTKLPHSGRIEGTTSSDFPQGSFSNQQRGRRGEEGEKSSEQPDAVNIFEQHLNVLPVWVWIPWIADIVSMLVRKEGLVLYKALVKVAQTYPQAIFYTLRSFMEERKLVDRPEKIQSLEAMNFPKKPIQALPDIAAEKYARDQKRHAENLKRKYEELQERYRTGQWGANFHPSEAERILQEARLQAEQAAARAQTAALSYERMHLSHNANPSFSQGSKQFQSEATFSSFDSRDSQGSMSSTGANISEENMTDETESQSVGQRGFASPFEVADHIMLHIVEKNHLLYMDMERLCSELSIKLKSQPEEQLFSLMNVVLQRCSQVSLHSTQKEISSSVRAALEEVSKLCFGTGLSDKGDFRVPYYLSDLKESFEKEVAPQTAENFPNNVDELIIRLQRWKKIIQQRIEGQHDVRYLERLSRYLVDAFDHSLSSSIEVFGMYHGWIGEPPVESFPHIDRFIPQIAINNEGSTFSRRIQILGSNGATYHFIAESSVSTSLQRSEERTAHLLTLMSQLCLEKHASTRRRRLSIRTLHSIPTGTHSRLLTCDGRPMNVSLMQPILDYCRTKGIELDQVTDQFREHYASLLSLSNLEEMKDKISQKEYLINCRLKAFERIVANYIPRNVLEDWFASHMKDIASLYQFQKEFSRSYAVDCFVQYVLGLGCRKPQSILLDNENGTVIFAGLRTLLSNRRVVESEEAVPFRLTPNISSWLRYFGHLGYFSASFHFTRMVIFEHAKLLKSLLEYFIREDIISLYASRQMSSTGNSSRAVQSFMEWNDDVLSDVESKLSESVDWILSRLDEAKDSNLPSLRSQVENSNRLVRNAEDWKNICQMESNWLPWY